MKSLFTILFLLVCFITNSQSVKVTYSEKRIISQEKLDAMPSDVKNATIAEMSIPMLFFLEFSEGISFYQIDQNAVDFKYRSESITIDENGKKIRSSIIADKKITPFFYYKEVENNLILFKMTNSNINFNGKDSLIDWEWKITRESQIIKGYLCKKAISEKFDSLLIAWFTEEIPVNAGPEKYHGLPGLILKVRNLGQEFTAEKIEIIQQKISIVKPTLPMKTVTFLEMYEQASRKFNSNKRFGTKKVDGVFTRTAHY